MRRIAAAFSFDSNFATASVSTVPLPCKLAITQFSFFFVGVDKADNHNTTTGCVYCLAQFLNLGSYFFLFCHTVKLFICSRNTPGRLIIFYC